MDIQIDVPFLVLACVACLLIATACLAVCTGVLVATYAKGGKLADELLNHALKLYRNRDLNR